MDQQRGRSPSGEHHQAHLSHSQSPTPQQYSDNINSNNLGLGIDSTLSGNNFQQFSNDNYSLSQNLSSFDNNNGFLGSEQDQQFSSSGLDNSTFGQNQEFNLQSDFSQQFKQDDLSSFGGHQQSFTQDLLNANSFNEDFSLYSTPATQSDQLDPNFFLNDPSQQSSGNVNPADLMSDMSSPMTHAPTPPHLLHPDGPQSSSAQLSPSFNQHQFQPASSHSRNTSLGPESAAFPNRHGMPNEWNLMQPQFTTHRRTPSEYSDVSASSITRSPNLVQRDSFEVPDQRHSPMVNPQDVGLYQELHGGIQSFSLSDPQIQHAVAASPHHGLSPAHSPAVSPRLGPQQGPMMNQQSPFSLNMSLAPNNYGSVPGSDMFPGQIDQGEHANSSEMGQAQQMPPPEIKFEFAPASRQNSFDPPKPLMDQDALTPPDRGRGRRRAASDPYNTASGIQRSQSPSSMSPGVGSDAGSLSPHPARSLSPLDRSGSASPSHRRRQSTSSLPNREYILGLARDPEQSPGNGENGNAKRVQKHPATFQCTLCPKRFTRAYNLRSHLRTHTDERPFVCTVCGKAFARQHDRKRHEGLHSGEKKFVCKGELKQGGQWGCGRRFARADALGRHFRSEAGRICIKPLLDEEAIERQQQWQEQQLQNMANMQQQQQPQSIAVNASGFPMDASGNYTLPAALLAQYPALANLSWADLPQGDGGMEDEISGRSSFDASGSEFYDEGDEAGYVSGPGTGFGPGQQMSDGYEVGYASDYGGR